MRNVLTLVLVLCSCAPGVDELHTDERISAITGPVSSLVLPIHPATGRVSEVDGVVSSVYNGVGWQLGTTELRLPVPVIDGDAINAWSVSLIRPGMMTTGTEAQLQRLDATSGIYYDVGPVVADQGSDEGPLTLGTKFGSFDVVGGMVFSLVVRGTVPGDSLNGATVYGVRHAAALDRVLAIPAQSAIGGVVPVAGGISLVGEAHVPIVLHRGDRIRSITIAHHGSGISSVDVTLKIVDAHGRETSPVPGAQTINFPPAEWLDTTIVYVDARLTNGDITYLHLSPNGPGVTIGGIRVAYE